MRKIILFLYFIVSISAVSLDELQNLMINKQYSVHGIFYKYDFANIDPAWDFVYVSNNAYYQLKGAQASSTNVFGWKIIDAVSVSSPSFYFIYLADVDEDNITKYDWVAISKTNSTINKLIGSTSSGYFSWSDNLSKLSFSFSADNKKVTFHKSIADGSSLNEAKLPKFPDLPDRLLDVNDTNVDDVKKSDDKDKEDDKSGDKDKEDDKSGDKSDNKDKEDDKSDGGTNNTCTQFAGQENSSCLTYYEKAKKFSNTPVCNGNISCMKHYAEQNLKDCSSFIDDSDSAPSPGQCKKWKP